MKRIKDFRFTFALFTIIAGSPAVAQTTTPATTPAPDQSSLGDYARKVHKDPTTKAKPKVFDNDNLPKDDKLSIVGDATPTGTDENTSADSTTKEVASTDGKDSAGSKPAGAPEDDQAKRQAEWKSWQGKLAAQKDSIDLASRELDVLQKEYQLRAAAMYADVGNRMRNSAQWDKETEKKKKKTAKKKKPVDDAKQNLDDMGEEAKKAGFPAAMREP